jgi:hypothetical protein
MSPEFQNELSKADIIFGKDEKTGIHFLVFGRSTLKSIVATRRSMTCNVLVQPVLQHTEELECLAAAVIVVKGHHEYDRSELLARWS